MSEIIIRPARPEDADALKTLLDRSWKTHWGPQVSAQSRARYEAEQPASGYVDACLAGFVVAERDGVVVGMHHVEGAYLHAIHVAADRLGQGVGSRLMDDAEGRGAARLDVRSFNSRARAFYAGRGWQEEEERDDTEMGTPVRSIIMTRGPARR